MSSGNLVDRIPAAAEVEAAARAVGARVYFVGGCVRDLLLDAPIVDVDIVAFGVPYQELAKDLASRLRATAVEFKDNVRLVKHDLVLDVSAPRGDTIEEDLGLRDFTINNLALTPFGKLIGDDADIRAGIIRMAGPDAFRDDALRIVRAFRFAATLGFDIDEHTLFAARSGVCSIKGVAVERVYAELGKLAAGKDAPSALERMRACGVLRHVLSEFCGVGDDILARRVAVTGRVLTKSRDAAAPVMLAALASGVLEPDVAKRMMNRLNAAKKDASFVERLVTKRPGMRGIDENTGERDLMRYAYRMGDMLEPLILLDAAEDGARPVHDSLRNAARTLDMGAKSVFTGRELVSMGFTPGPLFTTILDELHEMLATGELSGADAARKHVLSRWDAGNPGA